MESVKLGMTGARFIAETCKGAGITHVFFVESILRQALIEMEALGISRVLTHSEKAAAYMADGYARASHRPGICLAQSVGAANLASGLQDPFLGLSPVIAITGRRAPIALHRNAYQEIDHKALFDSVTKYNVAVEDIGQLPNLFRQAFREATSGAPGPVHLDVTDHMGQILEKSETQAEVIIEHSFTRFPSNRPVPEEHQIQAAARFLENASRPVIIAGGGVVASGAGPEVVRLAENLSIPVATSLNGKGSIPETHPLSLGVVGSYSRWCANRIVAESDGVLFVGSHTGDQVTNNWKIPRPGTLVVQIDIDPTELGRNYPNLVGLSGDAKLTVRKLCECLTARNAGGDWTRYAQRMVEDWRKEMEPRQQSDAVPIDPARLCKELTEVMPEDAILVADTGFSGIWTGAVVELRYPSQRYLRAAGSLGWGFPGALGAKCGAPESPVICFTGDGGFWYHVSELETAARCKINIVVVVNNNSCLAQPIKNIDRAYGERSGNKGEFYQFSRVNFAKIAEDMHCVGIRVEQPGEISGALKEALSANRPVVVDVVTDPLQRAPDPWAPV